MYLRVHIYSDMYINMYLHMYVYIACMYSVLPWKTKRSQVTVSLISLASCNCLAGWRTDWLCFGSACLTCSTMPCRCYPGKSKIYMHVYINGYKYIYVYIHVICNATPRHNPWRALMNCRHQQQQCHGCKTNEWRKNQPRKLFNRYDEKYIAHRNATGKSEKWFQGGAGPKEGPQWAHVPRREKRRRENTSKRSIAFREPTTGFQPTGTGSYRCLDIRSEVGFLKDNMKLFSYKRLRSSYTRDEPVLMEETKGFP